MKINWFSPLPPEQTEISMFTRTAAPALRDAFGEVSYWNNAPLEIDQCLFGNAIRYIPQNRDYFPKINEARATFYNMGNNYAFHHSIWEMASIVPGILILHDVVIQDFFFDWVTAVKSRDVHLRLIEKYYGTAGVKLVNDFYDGKVSPFELYTRFTLSPEIIRKSLVTVVHSEYARDILSKYKLETPIVCLDLPGEERNITSKRDFNQEKYNILLMGYLGGNRRVPEFLEAFAKFPHKNRFAIEIFGPVWEGIREAVNRLGLQEFVKFHGYVDELQLHEGLQRAHLGVNLRYPTMGEVSSSQLKLWNYGLSTLVSDIGWYSALPNTIVNKVRVGHELEDVSLHLTRFLENPSEFKKQGEAGSIYKSERHSATQYAAGLKKIVDNLATYEEQYFRRAHAAKLLGNDI